MSKQIVAVAVLCCLALFASAQKYHPDYQDGALWLKLKPAEELLTRKKEKLTVDDIRVLKPLKEKYKLKNVEKPFQKIRKTSPLQNTYLLTFDEINEADKLVKELEKSGVLEYAEKVPLNRTSVIPDDYIASTQRHLEKINAQGAWNLHTAAGNTVIAIVDDAVLTTHPDLAPNIWQNSGEIPGNGIDDDHNNYTDDVNGWDFARQDNNPNPDSLTFGHGTHVAGIASAATNNGTGIASIGFGAKLMCIKAASQSNIIAYGYSGIIYAADNGADVINLSWGNRNPSITGQNIINYALDKGCIIVAAAGNDNKQDLFYPASYPGVISVAATDNNDMKASFSNYGSAVTVSAPGVSIYSTTVDGSFGYKSGTSMASPLVAGLVALMHSYNPSMPNADLVNCLKSTASNINSLNPSYAGKLGVGRIDAATAMQCVQASLSFLPTADFVTIQTKIRAGSTITFTDSSAYATSLSWSFPGGSPSSSTARNPSVTYTTPGTYNVGLTVTNLNGSDIELKTGYIVVDNEATCFAMNLPEYDSFEGYVREMAEGDFVNGVNSKGIKQKAVYVDGSAVDATHMTRTWVWFSHASSTDPGKMITANVYDGTSGIPGTLLGSAALNIGTVMQDVEINDFSEFWFPNSIALPPSKKYFVSIDFSNLCFNCPTLDTLNIFSNINDVTTEATIWEQWPDNSWHQYTTAGSWSYNDSLYIMPIVTNYPSEAKIISSGTDICSGNAVSFNASGSTYENLLRWSFRDPNNNVEYVRDNPTPRALFSTPGNYEVGLWVNGGGCYEYSYTTVAITVNENVTPAVSLSSSTTAPGMPVTFTASATNGGLSPDYTFRRNGAIVQTGKSATWDISALEGNDHVSCTLTSDYACVTSSTANSNTITIDAVSMTTLPVELLYFKGSSASGTNLLQWATASEINTDKFVVERSTDGARFAEIGMIKAKGESNTTITYQFQDTRSASAYYRLRILDKDGSFKFSKVIYLGGNREASLTLWPNPATVGQEVQLVCSGRNTKQEIVQVIDAFGKVILKKTIAVKGGKLETGIPAQYLVPGLYIVTITDETTGNVRQQKLMIIK